MEKTGTDATEKDFSDDTHIYLEPVDVPDLMNKEYEKDSFSKQDDVGKGIVDQKWKSRVFQVLGIVFISVITTIVVFFVLKSAVTEPCNSDDLFVRFENLVS